MSSAKSNTNEQVPEEKVPEIQIDLSDAATIEFKRAFNEEYAKFCEALKQDYLKVKAQYHKEFNEKFENINKTHKQAYEEMNNQINELKEDFQNKDRRSNHLLGAVENFIALRYRRIFLRKVVDAWRLKHKKSHLIKAHEIYADNYAKRRAAQKSFIGWRKETHVARKRIIEQEFAFKVEELKTGKLAVYDRKIREALTKIEAAKRILAEEIEIKDKLTAQYEQALGRGVGALSKETQVISNNPLIAGILFADLLLQ